MQIERVMSVLGEAADADAVGMAAATLGRELFGLRECGVTWQPPAASPAGAAVTPAGWWVCDPLLLQPLLDALRARHEPVVHGDKLLLPVIEPAGLLGAICCAHDAPYTEELLRALTTLAAHVSVRLAQLGVRAANANVLGRLTRRQSDVALLAARGRPNSAIASALGLSENTVKKHLKDIFDELDVSNRTELAIRLGEAAVVTGPPGDERSLTRAAHVPMLRLASSDR